MKSSSRLMRAALVLTIGLGAGWLEPASMAVAAEPSSPKAAQAPDFSLKDLDGKVRDLKSQKGKVVLLSFWATWCGPCRVELPKLNAIYETLKDPHLTMYAVNVDDSSSLKGVKPMVQQLGIKFPVLLDTGNEVVNRYNPQGIIPFTVIIDQEGNVRAVHRGYDDGEEKKVEAELRSLLSSSRAAPKAADKK